MLLLRVSAVDILEFTLFLDPGGRMCHLHADLRRAYVVTDCDMDTVIVFLSHV